MPAKGIQLSITQGCSFSASFQCVDVLGANVNTSTVDAGPHVVRFRDKPLDAGGGIQATGSATINPTGLVTITFTAAETTKIKSPDWPWECRAVDGAVLWSVFQGTANLTLAIA